MISLDAKDRKILSELDIGARQSISSIAKKVGLSKEVVNYRIKQLENKGIIKGYYTALDVSKLGKLFYRLFVRFQNVSLEIEREMIDFAMKFQDVCGIVKLNGRWDILFVIITDNINKFKNFCDKLAYKFGKYFKAREISVMTKILQMKHKYLYDSRDDRVDVLGSDKLVNIDETDYKILGILANDARISTLEIARRLGMTPNTIKYRIKKLIESQVIICFRADIDIKKLSHQRHKVFLTLQDFTDADVRQMISFMKQNNHIIYVIESVGRADLEFEIDVRDSSELHDKINDFRDSFGNKIKDYEIELIRSEEYISYLPSDKQIVPVKSKE